MSDIKIIGIHEEGVGSPTNDGTPGSGLYAVPLRLSAAPSARWARAFEATWDRPPQFTTMHRPGIARVSGDTVILDGTTIEEVEKYHLDTAKLVADVVNRAEAEAMERDRQEAERRKASEEAHRRNVKDVTKRMDFD